MSTTPSSTTTSAIGVFDSGFGGLTVLRALVARLLRARFAFLGDTARLPCGSKLFSGFRCASLWAIFGSSIRDERPAPSGKAESQSGSIDESRSCDCPIGGYGASPRKFALVF